MTYWLLAAGSSEQPFVTSGLTCHSSRATVDVMMIIRSSFITEAEMEFTRTISWDPADKAQVAQARKEFNDAIKMGMAAYQTFEARRVPEQIHKFDAKLGEIQLQAPLGGG
jgi:hypothetical protein